MQTPPIFFELIVILFSIIIHEISHGYVAVLLGDPTPRIQGRLTLNPLKHIDPLGSIIVPIITSIGGFTFGWAKPIIFNPHNLKNKRWGELLIAIAGPGSNLLIAFVFGVIMRFGFQNGMLSLSFMVLCSYVVLINISLAVFNLVPIPPLDGSKVLFGLLPARFHYIRREIEKYSFILVLFLVVFLWHFFVPIIPYLFKLLVGF
jgi:Zn-dependent protease